MTATAPVASAAAGTRIIGVDLARAIAMLGMVIAHYVWPDQSGVPIDLLARATAGRAMPLFVILGGLGATILTARSSHPDRALLIRAALLFPLGVALQAATTVIAIILQSYSLFFVLAIMYRRLPTWMLAVSALVFIAIGSWTFQVVAPELTAWTDASQLISDPKAVIDTLIFRWPYPMFPAAGFFLFGMILGRLDLRSVRFATILAVGGTVVGFGTLLMSAVVVRLFDIERTAVTTLTGQFEAAKLLDTTGHSQMPAWVISASGTSVAILGLALLIAPRIGMAANPFVPLGQLALTFYAFQAVLIRFTPRPDTTPFSQELATVALIYLGFMAFAVLWRMRFRSGPLEVAFRVGSRSKRATPAAHPVAAGL